MTGGLEAGEQSSEVLCVSRDVTEVLELLIHEFFLFPPCFERLKMTGEGRKATCTYRIANRSNRTGTISVITDLRERC